MLKLLLFVAFVAAFGLWVWASLKVSVKVQRDAQSGRFFWGAQILVLLTYGGFFGFIFILSGWWSWQLVVLLLVATELTTLLALIVNAALGSDSTTIWLRSTWLLTEINARHLELMKLVTRLTLIVYLLYPIVVGISYFRQPLFSHQAQVSVVEYSLLLMVGSYPFAMVSMMALLSSKELDEGTRQSVFVNQLAGSVPTALLAALGFWAFRAKAEGFRFTVLGATQSISTRALIVMFLFFACLILVPFLLGTLRGRRQRSGFLRERSDYLGDLDEILEAPTRATYITKLEALKTEIESRRTTLIQSDSALVTRVQFSGADTSKMQPADQLLARALSQTGNLDERFKFVDALSRLETEIDEIVQDLQQRPPATLERAAEKWSRKFKARKTSLDGQAHAESASKSLVTVGVTTAATTIVSGALSLIGKAASSILIFHAGK